MRALLDLISAALLVTQVGCQPVPKAGPPREPIQSSGQSQPVLSLDQQIRESHMADSPVQVLKTSKDAKELVNAALSLARSKQPADHNELLRWLRSEEFLTRLDYESDYRNTGKRTRIRRVLEALSENNSSSAHDVLVALTQSPMFIKEPVRADSLIEACVVLRPAPSEVVRFWNDHSQPDDGFTHLTVEAIVENGSEPAVALLEQKMTDPRHDDNDKISWLRSSILTHRNDLPLLRSCERMLAGALPKRLCPHLVEVLFDYRPTEWFGPAELLYPPDRRQASAEALAQLRRLGQMALRTVALTEDQKKAVERTLKELGESK